MNTVSNCGKTKERKRPLLDWTEDKNMDSTQRWLKCSILSLSFHP